MLAEPIRQPLADQAREDVKRAPGAKADDDTHRPCRIGLCPCEARDCRQRGSARGKMHEFSAGKFHDVSSLWAHKTNGSWAIMPCSTDVRLSECSPAGGTG